MHSQQWPACAADRQSDPVVLAAVPAVLLYHTRLISAAAVAVTLSLSVTLSSCLHCTSPDVSQHIVISQIEVYLLAYIQVVKSDCQWWWFGIPVAVVTLVTLV